MVNVEVHWCLSVVKDTNERLVGKLDIEKLRPAEPGQLLVCA